MDRLCKVSIEDAFTHIGVKDRMVIAPGVKVGTSSLRLRTFKKAGCTCSSCGIEGQFFVAERNFVRNPRPEAEQGYHLNLYAVAPNGFWVLMTHDHIIARSQGGLDAESNVTTMCIACNNRKGTMSDVEFKQWKKATGWTPGFLCGDVDPKVFANYKSAITNQEAACQS